ncbi:MAG TPA: DEAD/DEAH box helicase, partial [Alphaproteobacteria bacterium]
LAMQVMATLQQMIAVPTIRTALLIGGEPMPKQFKQMNMNPRLVVGTPGRVIDHLSRGRWNLDNTRYLVLDETDRMLDMGFGIQLDKILEYVPSERQTMMFSATMPTNIVKLSSKYLVNPERVSVGSTVTPAANIKQETVRTTEDDKYNQLIAQLEARSGSVIIFVKTKYGAEKLATRLYRAEHKADAIHGDLKQNQRSRVIQAFREKKYRILVATDVAARGLDIPHIEHVINYDLPQCPEDYIHRIGRTARAGAEGSAINLVSPGDNLKWKAIQRMLDPEAAAAEQRANQARRFGNGSNSNGNSNRSGGYAGRSNNERRGNGNSERSNSGERNFYGDRTNNSERRPYAGDRPQEPRGNRFSDTQQQERRGGEQPRGAYAGANANSNNGGQRDGEGFRKEGGGFKKKFGGPSPFTKDNGFSRKPGGAARKKFGGSNGGPKRSAA